jgi:hypothetical protein
VYPFCSAMASINWDSVRVTEGSLGFYKDGKTSKTFEALDWPRGEPGCKHWRN